MNQLQAQILENIDDLPKRFLQEIADYSEYLKKKAQKQAYHKRMRQSEKDLEEGRVKTVTPDELFQELEI